ncbi:MAG: response regulator [Gammaproteobacteria bacterium]|nr:MAG: response regulator [Gammaproteobacteria bacterium]
MTEIQATLLGESDAERTIRDMMGLLALPALWANRDSEDVLQIMSEAIEHIVPIVFSYTNITLSSKQEPVDCIRVHGRPIEEQLRDEWLSASNNWAQRRQPDARVQQRETPLGIMKIVRFSMSYGVFSGHIWFGSDSDDFPTVAHLAYLRAATSLAVNGLQTARATRELKEAGRAKDEFLAMLGHELRNPLSPMVAALKIMELKAGGALTSEHLVLNRQVRHLRRLVDDLLDVSRITQGKVQLKREALDLKTVLVSAIEVVRPLLEERGHQFTAILADSDACIFGDETRLVQVFTNLLTNAAKYTDPGGLISLTLVVEEETVTAQIKDNGVGISPRLFPRLFTIFEQGTSTIDRGKGGLGIGLAIVRSFVELHGGSVVAHSEGIGHGSEFKVALPRLHRQKIELSKHPESFSQIAPSARILLVDDNVDALETLEMCLQAYGYDVAIASDPLEALEVADAFLPSVAILDIGLPIMDGYQLAKEMRKKFPSQNLRLIALTGYGQTGDRESTSAAGFDLHLVKPIDLDILLGALSDDSSSKLINESSNQNFC